MKRVLFCESRLFQQGTKLGGFEARCAPEWAFQKTVQKAVVLSKDIRKMKNLFEAITYGFPLFSQFLKWFVGQDLKSLFWEIVGQVVIKLILLK